MRKKVLSDKAMQQHLEDMASHPSYAEYVSGGQTFKVPVEVIVRPEESRFFVQFVINDEIEEDKAITRVTVYNENSDIWADSEENIVRESFVDGIFYRFVFKLAEGKVAEED